MQSADISNLSLPFWMKFWISASSRRWWNCLTGVGEKPLMGYAGCLRVLVWIDLNPTLSSWMSSRDSRIWLLETIRKVACWQGSSWSKIMMWRCSCCLRRPTSPIPHLKSSQKQAKGIIRNSCRSWISWWMMTKRNINSIRYGVTILAIWLKLRQNITPCWSQKRRGQRMKCIAASAGQSDWAMLFSTAAKLRRWPR